MEVFFKKQTGGGGASLNDLAVDGKLNTTNHQIGMV